MSAPEKGSSVTAIVEETLDNCIMVRVIHGSRTFRGVLIDENNSSISRTPLRGVVERTREIPPDFTPQERSSIVMLQNSPRRTANSRKSGLSQRLILLSQQEEGRSETVIVNSQPTDDLRGFVNHIDRSQFSDVRKKRGRPLKRDKPLKKTAAKAKGGVKRKKNLPKDFVRPFKRPRSLVASPSKTGQDINQGKSLNNIVLKPCLVKLCPLKKPILNQSSTANGVQTLHARKPGLNSVSEEKIARQFHSGGQDVQTRTMSRIPGIRRVSVDLEQLPMSSAVADKAFDTVSLLSEGTSIIDIEKLSGIVNISGEETDSATSFIDEDVILETAEEKTAVATSIITQDEGFQTVDISSEESGTATNALGNEVEETESFFTGKPEASTDVGENASAVISVTTQDDEFEAVDISSEESGTATNALGNEVEETESFFTGKPEASTDVGENASAVISVTTQDDEFETVDILIAERATVTNVLGNEVEKTESFFIEKPEASTELGENTSAVVSEMAHSQGDGTSIHQNDPQTSDANVTTKISNRGNNIGTEPDSLPIVPQTSSECERVSNCSGSSTAMLSIVVKLEPINMDTGEEISTPNATTQSDAGCTSPRVSVEDIVWGKVHDHPWWPGKVAALSGTVDEVGSMLAKDASIAWFGSNTRSVLPVMHLSHFLANFNERHLPDKDGCYRIAVQEAIQAHKHQLISISYV